MFEDAGIWVAGEALIDLVPNETNSRVAIVGGGPANTAKALANLGHLTQFIGGISNDDFGKAIENELTSYGVNLDFAHYSKLPTATAIVTLDGSGNAEYEFSLTDTATFDFHQVWLPHGKPKVLHVGTLATIIEPGATELLNWASGIEAPIVFDPNVRPSVLADSVRYRDYVEKWMRISSVVKMSEDDLHWLYPQRNSARELLEFGPRLIIITHGAKGLTAHQSSTTSEVPGIKVNVVDTVGAGDTAGAIIVESIAQIGIDQTLEKIEKVLYRAAKAAAITCSRLGARPPSKDELLGF